MLRHVLERSVSAPPRTEAVPLPSIIMVANAIAAFKDLGVFCRAGSEGDDNQSSSSSSPPSSSSSDSESESEAVEDDDDGHPRGTVKATATATATATAKTGDGTWPGYIGGRSLDAGRRSLDQLTVVDTKEGEDQDEVREMRVTPPPHPRLRRPVVVGMPQVASSLDLVGTSLFRETKHRRRRLHRRGEDGSELGDSPQPSPGSDMKALWTGPEGLQGGIARETKGGEQAENTVVPISTSIANTAATATMTAPATGPITPPTNPSKTGTTLTTPTTHTITNTNSNTSASNDAAKFANTGGLRVGGSLERVALGRMFRKPRAVIDLDQRLV